MNLRITIISFWIFLLAACAGTPSEQHEALPSGMPENAIQTGANTYMVPLDNPVQNCPAYRLVSPGQMTIQVIYFKQKDGSYQPTREDAVCE